MARYVWDREEQDWVEPSAAPIVAKGPFIWRDLPPYTSPLGTGVIDGRRARREDLARGGCREVDPSERIDAAPKTAQDAARERAMRHANQQTFDPAVAERLMKGR